MHDPLVFIRKTLENAVDARDEDTIRAMSDMIDQAMIAMTDAHDSAVEKTG